MNTNTETPKQDNKTQDALGIFNSVFGENVSLSLYSKKLFDNPFKLADPFSISYEDGKAVGVAIFMGMKLAIAGRDITVSQAIDCAVLPDHQGKGHFYKAVHSFETDNQESEFIFGFPNKVSFPYFMKFGYSMPVWLYHYIYPTSPMEFVFGKNVVTGAFDKLWQKFLSLYKSSRTSEEELSIHEDMNTIPLSDDEFDSISSEMKCHFRHTQAFFKWKYAYNPDLKFYWSILRKKDGTLQGYALCHLRHRLKGNFVIIDDYAVMPDITDKQHVLKVIFSSLAPLGDILEVPFANEEIDGPLLKKLHFINACKFPFPLHGGPVILSPNCQYTSEMKNCSFRNIDSDVL